MKINRKIFVFGIFMSVTTLLSAQETWEAPADKASRLSPFAFTDENRAEGKRIYEANCASCHGTPGQGNYNKDLVPLPGDPATDKIQRNSDGSLFYKVFEGKGLMPSFKNSLSSTDIWNVIAYLRSFNPTYAQEVARKIVEGTFGVDDLKLVLEYLSDQQQIKATLAGTKEGAPQFVPNAEVQLFAKRYFGNLPVDEVKRTDESGAAFFAAPAELPGDTAGFVNFFARLPNEELYGTVEADTALQAGVPTHPVSLRAQRAMWNTVWRAPVWLLITYFGGVILIWSFILYIVGQIYKIFVVGKEEIDNNNMQQ